ACRVLALFPTRRSSDLVFKRVFHMVEVALDLFMDYFDVTEGRLCCRIPVDDILSAVDQPFVVHVDKDFADRIRQPFVHGEALFVIIQSQAKLLPLAPYETCVFLFPVPCMLQKLFASDFMTADALFTE